MKGRHHFFLIILGLTLLIVQEGNGLKCYSGPSGDKTIDCPKKDKRTCDCVLDVCTWTHLGREILDRGCGCSSSYAPAGECTKSKGVKICGCKGDLCNDSGTMTASTLLTLGAIGLILFF